MLFEFCKLAKIRLIIFLIFQTLQKLNSYFLSLFNFLSLQKVSGEKNWKFLFGNCSVNILTHMLRSTTKQAIRKEENTRKPWQRCRWLWRHFQTHQQRHFWDGRLSISRKQSQWPKENPWAWKTSIDRKWSSLSRIYDPSRHWHLNWKQNHNLWIISNSSQNISWTLSTSEANLHTI
jgi:hypothetical protein